ncbi:MAG: ankyrin repeat domain-containing protein [Acidobacteriota bacterium]
MRLTRLFLLLFTLATPLAVVAQDAKQELNNQMWEAVRKGDVVAVTAALDKGADVNAKFRYGTTALFKAAERGHADVVKLLLARGVDVSVKDTFYGTTAMTWALDNDHVEAVRAILEKDDSSATQVMMTGAREGKVALVEMAVAKGGLKPEALTSAYAIVMNDKEKTGIAEILKKAGATPPLEIDAAILQSYSGRFRPETGAELVLSVKEGRLFAAPTGQQPIAMMALDKTTFKPVAFDGIVITFTVEGDKVPGFTLTQGPNKTPFKRVEEVKQP